MSTDTFESKPSPHDLPGPGQSSAIDAGPLGLLTRLSGPQVRLERLFARLAPIEAGLPALPWLDEALGSSLQTDGPELLMRGSGLLRPGLVAELHWPSRRTRLGLGIETPVGHAIVDRLLGFDRTDAESRRQLTPVESGILTFVVARCLEDLSQSFGSLGLDDLALDRVGTDPFSTRGLGTVVTLRWPVRIANVMGAVRLWLPLELLAQCLEERVDEKPRSGRHPPHPDLASHWRAEAGTISMPRGVGRLRVGGVLPIDGRALQGSPQSPAGVVRLVLELANRGGRCSIPAAVVPHSGGGRLTLTSTLQNDPIPRESLSMSSPSELPPPPPVPGRHRPTFP